MSRTIPINIRLVTECIHGMNYRFVALTVQLRKSQVMPKMRSCRKMP